MEPKYFSLGPSETGLPVRVIRILFGLVCYSIAIFWIIFSIRSVKSDITLWITVTFLCAFGSYQILAGLGRTTRFIEISSDRIVLRKNSLLPRKEMISSQIKRIEIYPMSLAIYYSTGGKTILRFGTEYTDRIDPVNKAIEDFATRNNIEFEEIT